ncbi:NAD(P)/FAD-dependent oxidoreductase [Christiangramia sabulilitoris]|uniref:NAD(P)/FAD-dependent oxidoreductase n=1 Tax=Christiangramia sabulilitoris TaxID=2583991 RepID=A0A550I605_9FLAO|nr:NAD(P)/FAD-dependent oxidoreductase [Christiangramia sabulilitoris]TRO66410.1 NAD(P)/FAD-dependent oxidoreductase [Christiangramia sabulilitoris]
MKKDYRDIVIIGAGPSGSVAAGYLQQQDASVLILENKKFPRFSIGESLIPRCMDNFEEAGFLNTLKSQGYQKKYGARFIKQNEIASFDFSKKYGEGWNWTWQVPRAEFDKSLTDDLAARGVEIRFETKVESVIYIDGIWKIETVDIEGKKNEVSCKFIIDSSGNGRVLAKHLDLEAPPKIYDHSSIFTHIKETSRPKGFEGEQISFEIINRETWFWYIPFSNGISSLGFVGPDSWFDQFSTDNSQAFLEMLKQTEFYQGRFDDYPHKFVPGKIKNISKNVKYKYGKGFALTGNSAEFLDPVFSSGVAFATESGLLAAKLAWREINGETIDWENNYAKYIQRGVDVFSTYVKEWYSGKLQDIFFHPEPNPMVREQICAVLAGYVWNRKNPFVRNHARAVKNLYKIIHEVKIN